MTSPAVDYVLRSPAYKKVDLNLSGGLIDDRTRFADIYGDGKVADFSQGVWPARTVAQFTAANSEYLHIADNASVSVGDIDFAWAGWVYIDTDLPAASVFRGIFCKDASGTREYQLLLDGAALAANVRFNWIVRNGAGAEIGNVSANTFGGPSISTWYFVVAYHDAANNLVGISVNGGAFDTAATTGMPSDNTSALVIGNDAFVASRFWNGRIGASLFTKRVLTAAEITWLYNGGLSMRRYSEIGASHNAGADLKTSLVSYWELNEASGTRNDSHGTNHLTDNNTVTQAAGVGASAGRIQVPNIRDYLNETEGWVATLMRMGWVSTADPSANPVVFEWVEDANNFLELRYDTGVAAAWEFQRRNTGGTAEVSVADTWALDDLVVVIAAWDVGTLELSVDGATPTSQAGANIPAITATALDIGSAAGTAEHISADVLAEAKGRGQLSNADSYAINYLLRNQRMTLKPHQLPGNCRAIWLPETGVMVAR